MHIEQYELALWDSERCVQISPDLVKAHFRRGKSLLGLGQYAEAVDALTFALKLKKNNKEIRDTLQIATIQKNEKGNCISSEFYKLNGCDVLKYLEDVSFLSKAAILLAHLYHLFKKYYAKELDIHSRHELLGCDAEDLGNRLHYWSLHVDLKNLMEVPGVLPLLFECDLISDHLKSSDGKELNDLEDLSCHQFSLFVSAVLSRLVIQGNAKYGVRALKRLIVLDSNKLVRDSVGGPLTLATLQASGHGGWGLPRMPGLRQLFIQYGGLRCVALDSKEDITFQSICSKILAEVTIAEWEKQSVSLLEVILSHFILPSLDSTVKLIRNSAVGVFSRIYAIPEIRDLSFEEWAKNTEKAELADFCMIVTSRHKILTKREQTKNKGIVSDTERGEKIARFWVALPIKQRSLR
uniref:Uncharacterized protein n=1 Tax=Arcella intermedia TaxID=1963864 RepID=A0A6B2L400_9EUKA